MAQKIYHHVEHKIVNITVYFRKRYYIYLEILKKMYEKMEYHRMILITPS